MWCRFSAWEKQTSFLIPCWRWKGNCWGVLYKYLIFQRRITYLAVSYQRRRFKGSYWNFKEDEWLIYDVYFHFWRASDFDGEKGRHGFVIEVKNNKATACWRALPVQRPWYKSNALCMALRTSRETGKHVAFDPAFLLLSFIWPVLQNCHRGLAPDARRHYNGNPQVPRLVPQLFFFHLFEWTALLI